MGFLSNLISAGAKVALSPLAVAKDALNVVTGEEADTLKNLLESAKEDIEDAGDDLADGEL